MFDYSILMNQVSMAYSRIDNPKWCKQDVFEFFIMFYEAYFYHRGYDHKRLKTDTIQTIIERIPEDDMFEYRLDDYRMMIDRYFKTYFANCDYSIVHFMSGTIRQIRYFETCY